MLKPSLSEQIQSATTHAPRTQSFERITVKGFDTPPQINQGDSWFCDCCSGFGTDAEWEVVAVPFGSDVLSEQIADAERAGQELPNIETIGGRGEPGGR